MAFANAQALLLAYQNLEREFTKKSQQLKEIKNKMSCDNEDVLCDEKQTSPQEKDMDNFALQNPDLTQNHVDNPAQANEVFAQQLASDNEFLQKYIFANPNVTNQILQRYLLTLSQNDLPATINGSGGAMSLTPPKRPKTIKEASVLAQKLFK